MTKFIKVLQFLLPLFYRHSHAHVPILFKEFFIMCDCLDNLMYRAYNIQCIIICWFEILKFVYQQKEKESGNPWAHDNVNPRLG